MKKIQWKGLLKNKKTRKILIYCLIGAAVLAAVITAAVLMDASIVRLVNSNAEAGSLIGGGRISSGSTTTVRAQANPGYVFLNWTNADGSIASAEPTHKLVVPESNITLTANWKLSDWEVILNLDSDTNTTAYPATVTVKDDIIFLNDPTKEGYTFLGWYKDELLTVPADDFIPSGTTANVILYARWAPSYTIEYDLGDPFASNNPDNPETYTEYKNVDLKHPVFYERNDRGQLTGGSYKFEGWYDEGGNKVETILADRKENVKLTAHWDKSKPVFYTTYERGGMKYVELGRYPQHILDDQRTAAEMKAKIADGTLVADPVTGLYTYNNTFFAKVTAKPYQNDAGTYYSQFSNDTDVKKDEDYFFIVEPIVWRVLSGDPNDPNSELLLLSESVLSAGLFREDVTVRAFDGLAVYANNWQYSDMRAFLNGAFLNEAFMEGELRFLSSVSVDFSKNTSHFKRYANGKTCDDLVFLLSYADTANRNYGWNHWTINEDPLKVGKATDYAKAMGVYASLNGGDEHDAAHWWLRSSGDFEGRAAVTTALGNIGTVDVTNVAIGIRPAIQVKLGR